MSVFKNKKALWLLPAIAVLIIALVFRFAVSPSTDPNEQSDELTCTLSVCCDTLLDHLTLLDAEKAELVPVDGVIYPERSVTFSDGETVFDVLLRETQKAQIHMEYSVTPLYNSVYIEGIGNLYELDAGDLSGWMYRVNGEFPNFGCSLYTLKDGDVIEWVYTCDLGADVGGAYAAQSGER